MSEPKSLINKFLENRKFSGAIVSLIAGFNLFFITKCFYLDWANHVWSINYIGEYFFSHWEFPSVINTPYISGLPIPVFYHSLFGEVFGVLCWPLGANITFRILAILMMYWQFQTLVNILAKNGAQQKASILFATAYTWAPYLLTNIYNRAAMTEWFALVFLTVAICHLVPMLDSLKTFDLLAFVTLMALSIAAHPITGLLGSLLSGLLFLATYIDSGFVRKQIQFFLGGGFLIGILSSPWLFALFDYRKLIHISERSQDIVKFPNDIDLWWVRNFPFPFDVRMFGNSGEPVSTPNLTAQFSWGLLILILPALFKKEKWNPITKLGIGLLVTFWFLSFNELIWDLIPSFFHIIQFKYRLISFVHLSLFIITLGLLKTGETFQISKRIVGIILAVSSINVGLKLYQGHQSILAMDWKPGPEKKLEVPQTYYGLIDYATLRTFDPLNQEIKLSDAETLKFQVSSESGKFGEIAPLTVNFNEDRIVRFPVLPFVWNHVTVNGAGIKTYWHADVFGGENSRIPVVFLAGIIPKGPATIRIETFPPDNYSTLRFLSLTFFVAFIASMAKIRFKSHL